MQSSRKNRLFSAAVVIGGMLTVTGVAGCGRGGLPMADVHGEVKFDGQPIETGSIAFHPEDGLGPSTGGEIKNGQYAVRVPPGAKKIEISRFQASRHAKPTPENPVQEPIYMELIPPIYNIQTTLSEEVRMPDTQIDLDLKPLAGSARR